ncbi:hypothetical protein BGZ65_010391 [Modicella reniformis]|uniref:Uncharacterized protein n=1 Tax=Modicella reniformis TaxID=1440133 RepID=A0A9P6J3X1_9FUNG|nr:hypothetical protein BGZ65_010391 [Modicella reniformis]
MKLEAILWVNLKTSVFLSSRRPRELVNALGDRGARQGLEYTFKDSDMLGLVLANVNEALADLAAVISSSLKGETVILIETSGMKVDFEIRRLSTSDFGF